MSCAWGMCHVERRICLEQAGLTVSCGLVPRLLVNLIKRRPQITEEQLKTIAGGFTAMMDKCCKQADINACLGEEVLSSSFFKTNPKTTHMHKKQKKNQHKKHPNHAYRNLESARESCSAKWTTVVTWPRALTTNSQSFVCILAAQIIATYRAASHGKGSWK